jgi:hypothetical protein
MIAGIRLPLVLFLLLIVTACGPRDAAPSPSPAASLSGISLEAGEDEPHRLTVTDADGMEMRIRIRWSEYDGMYRTEGRDGGLAGPLFGNPEPKFATAEELGTARDIVGTPMTTDGVADLLWAIFMLPEFQLVR